MEGRCLLARLPTADISSSQVFLSGDTLLRERKIYHQVGNTEKWGGGERGRGERPRCQRQWLLSQILKKEGSETNKVRVHSTGSGDLLGDSSHR